MSTYRVSWRDRFAWWVTKIAIDRIATREYRAFIYVVNAEGKKRLDALVGRGTHDSGR